jgi:hypothetical protein
LVSNTLDVECTIKLRSDNNVMLTYNSSNETNEDLVNLPPKKKGRSVMIVLKNSRMNG